MKHDRPRRFESLGPRYLLTGISLVHQPAILHAAAVLATRDMDADGDHDIVVAKEDSLAWLENQSQNGVSKFEEHPIANVNSGLYDLADLDGDHDLDLIIREPENGISVLENNDDGFVKRQIIDSTPERKSPWLVRAADMDSDGDEDLVSVTSGFLGGGGEISWYANDGSGNFDTPRVFNE